MKSDLALFGGTPAWAGHEEHQPVDADQRRAVERVLTQGDLSGTEVERFERAFARVAEVDHAIAVNSGTSALHAVMLALGIGPGDEVITPAYGFVASASVIVQQGATPVFCDVTEPDLNIDPVEAARLIGARTRAIIAVHIFGLPADHVALRRLCDEHGLAFVEDCASAPMARRDGRRVGTLADAACFSLNSHKVVRTGEGGIVTTSDAALAERVREIRRGDDAPSGPCMGYAMPDPVAALGTAQLERIDLALQLRRRNRELLFEGCAGLAMQPIRAAASTEPVGYWSSFSLDPELVRIKPELIAALRAEGVFAHGGYGAPLHHIEYLRPYGRDDLSVVERIAPRVLSFDPSPWFTEDDMRGMTAAIRKVFALREHLAVDRASPVGR